MAFCQNCGAQVEGAFCMRCGAPMAGGAPQPPQQPQQPPQQPPPGAWGQQQPPPQQPPYGQQQYGQQPPYGQPAPAASGIEDNLAGALCYTPFLGLLVSIVFLVLEPYNKMKSVRFHAFQSLFFCVAGIVLNIAMSIVFTVMRHALPYSTWILFTLVSSLVSLAFLGACVFLMYKAYNRDYFKIPVIGDLAEKQA